MLAIPSFCFTFTFNSDGIVVVHSECRQMTIWLGFIWNKERMQPDGLSQNREERWAGLALMGSWDYLVKWVRCCSVVLSSKFPNFPVRNRHAERISPRSWPCTWRVSGWNIVKIQDDTVVYLMTSLPVADFPQIWLTQSFSDSELKDDYLQVLLLLYWGLYRRWPGWASSAAQTWSGSAMRAGLVSCIWTGDLKKSHVAMASKAFPRWSGLKVSAQTPDVLDGVEILVKRKGKSAQMENSQVSCPPVGGWCRQDLKTRWKMILFWYVDVKTAKIRKGAWVIKRGSDIRRRKKEVKKFSERSNQQRFSQSEENSLQTVKYQKLPVDQTGLLTVGQCWPQM